MFENSGKKCMAYAKALFWVSCIVDTIGVIVVISILEWCDGAPALLLTLPVLWALNWVASLMIYTLGEACELARKNVQAHSNQAYDTTTNQAPPTYVPKGGWICPVCGIGNASYVTSCPCGHKKDSAVPKNSEPYITCTGCGYSNPGGRTNCIKCGKSFVD